MSVLLSEPHTLPAAPHHASTTLAGISVVIPAYNEEHGIGPVLTQLNTLMQQQPRPYEIIVIDDGSRDNTAAVVHALPDITLIRHTRNRGYGAALKTGIRRASHPLICITDADGTYPNERMFDLVALLEANQSDMVVGARTGEQVAIPLVRRPAKWFIGKLANYVAGQKIPDINSGFRVFRRDAVRRFFALLPNGFSFTTTITLGMMTSNYLVDYVSVNYHARVGRSKIKPIRDTLNFIQLILRIGLYFVPLKIFLPLSLLLLVLALVWGIFSTLVLQQLADVSTLMIAMTGVQVAIFGLLAELINHRMPSAYLKEGEEE
ncbi:MAG: glycosyltransferase family 2 protein [Chloroflexaceae bacterium]|nr:glycosyltransferase family 2 protein [Chloroflexaceae bacterium]